MVLKPLCTVKEIVEAAGMGISYVYEDLVFIDHNALLLEFTQNENELLVHINEKAVRSELGAVIIRLQEEASAREMTFTTGSLYRISQNEEENIRLEFIPESNQLPEQ
jgi:hypothetical protein